MIHKNSDGLWEAEGPDGELLGTYVQWWDAATAVKDNYLKSLGQDVLDALSGSGRHCPCCGQDMPELPEEEWKT